MSATGRGTTREPRDFYATPKAAFEPLLQYLPRDCSFWEPCAGDGRLIRWLRESGRVGLGGDLFPQPSAVADYNGMPIDYLADPSLRDFVLTNPPFGVAFEMCQHAWEHSREFMFLLRLSFLESDERGDWLSAHEPAGLWVLKKRPSFVMSVTCKSDVSMPKEAEIFRGETRVCKHNWLLPIESERPKVCPKCGGSKLAISTSDNSGYGWFYWSKNPRPELCGIHHI